MNARQIGFFVILFMTFSSTKTVFSQDKNIDSEKANIVKYEGDSTLNKFKYFVQKNIDYSTINAKKVLKKSETNKPKAFVQFVVSKENKVSDIIIVKPLENNFDNQIIKIISESNGWETKFISDTGKVFLVIPIRFDPNNEYLKELEDLIK